MPSGAFLAARQWAKFGELLRQGGRWESEQIIRADLLQELLTGSKANPRYGMTFWLNIKGGVGAGDDAASRSTTPTADSIQMEDLFMAADAVSAPCDASLLAANMQPGDTVQKGNYWSN